MLAMGESRRSVPRDQVFDLYEAVELLEPLDFSQGRCVQVGIIRGEFVRTKKRKWICQTKFYTQEHLKLVSLVTRSA